MRLVLEVRKKKKEDEKRSVQSCTPKNSSNSKYIPTILIFFLATFEVNYKEQKTRYIPTKPSDFKTTNDNFLW